MPSNGFSTNAEEIRYYMEQLLQDGQVHSIREIKTYVKEHSPSRNVFTEGMFAGAIYSLVHNSNGKYANPERGKYQMVCLQPITQQSTVGDDLKNKVVQILENSCLSLSNACTVNIIGLSAAELAIAEKVKKIICTMEDLIREIRSV